MSNSTRWPRSSDVIRSNIDADSYLFTVHLQSRSAHPYPLKPFTRAVAALNLQPKVQEIVKALNASVKQTIEERAAIRSTTSHQLKTRSSSPLQTTFYPISPIQTSNSGVTLTSTVKSFGVEELLTHHSSSSTSSFLTHHSSSSTSSFSLSPLTIIKLQGKRHESKAWTSSYSPSKLTLEALRYHTNSSLTLGKSHTVFIPQQAPEPPLILQSITLEKKQQEKLKQIISPTTLSSSIPTVLSHRSLTDTRDMITGHDNVHENKEGEGYVAIADSPRSLVSNVVNIVKPIVLTPLLSALRISTIKNGKNVSTVLQFRKFFLLLIVFHPQSYLCIHTLVNTYMRIEHCRSHILKMLRHNLNSLATTYAVNYIFVLSQEVELIEKSFLLLIV
jgi:hypothetical protein